MQSENTNTNTNTNTICLALVVCATLVWITEAEECGRYDQFRCGNKCHGKQNTCKCGNQSWKGRNSRKGCCPFSPDSCIKEKDGKTIFKTRHTKVHFFILLIFTGNVTCQQGSVLSLGKEECPVLGQCLSYLSSESSPICEDPKTSEKFCAEEKWAHQICRGIPNVGCKE